MMVLKLYECERRTYNTHIIYNRRRLRIERNKIVKFIRQCMNIFIVVIASYRQWILDHNVQNKLHFVVS